MATDYRWDNEALKKRVQDIVSRKEYDEFADLREYPPAMNVGTVFYSSKEAFADAVKKKLGGQPVSIKKASDWVQSLTRTEDKPGVEFVILVDEAILAGYSKEAQVGLFHRVLSFLKLQGKVDKDTGEWSPTTDNGRPIYKIDKPEAQSKDTIRRFGAIDAGSAEFVSAAQDTARGQTRIKWEAEIPADL